MTTGWGDLPPVTASDPTDIRFLLDQAQAVLDLAPSTDSVLSFFGFNLSCCGSKSKSPLPDSKEFWDTASLRWWDFQSRRMQAIFLAKKIRDRVRQAEKDYEQMESEGCKYAADMMFAEIHRRNAIEMREYAESAKGLFVKATQQMSTMAGVLPDVYCTEFTKTTEHLPVSSPDEVYRVIERDLARDPKTIFQAFDREPVASASIGQVHKARLAGSGELVAVKVQHDGVERVFTEDLYTLAILADKVSYWIPGLDLRPAVEEWQEVIPRELDFRLETDALSRAHEGLRNVGSMVRVPTPREEVSSQQVCVMDFIDALPITKLASKEFCVKNRLEKLPIMTQLLEAFAMLTFREGLIHGDPHAGNIHLLFASQAPGGGVPVILDWGMTKMLENDERLSLAKFFHALANMDMNGIFDALHFLGFKFSSEKLTGAMQEQLVDKLRAGMKDTLSKDQTRARTSAGKTLGQREEEASNLSSLVTQWPKSIVFFIRMIECMRGLCVTCNATGLPVLQIFSARAREAVTSESLRHSFVNSARIFKDRPKPRLSEVTRRTSAAGAPPAMMLDAKINAALERRVSARCATMIRNKTLVGAQVAVVQAGHVVCDVAQGSLSTIDMRPIEQTTRFPLMDAVAGLATLALLHEIRDWFDPQCGQKHNRILDIPVKVIWPEFGQGNSSMTIKQILGHRAGVQDAFPPDFGPQYLNNFALIREYFEQTSLSAASEPRYAYLLHVFLVMALAEHKNPQLDLLSWLEDRLGLLGLDIALPSGDSLSATICRDLPNLARVSLKEIEDAKAKHQESAPVVDNKCTLFNAISKHPLAFDPLMANVSHATGSRTQLRAGFPLAASARGLATMLSSIDLQQNLRALNALEVQGKDSTALGWFLTGGACRFGQGGLQLLELAPRGLGSLCGKPQQGYGVVSGLGPCVMHFPDLGQGGVTVAVTVNNVLHGRMDAARLVREVFAHYGYKPTWTHIPIHVAMETGRLLAEHKMAASVLQQLMTERGANSRFGCCPGKLPSCVCCR